MPFWHSKILKCCRRDESIDTRFDGPIITKLSLEPLFCRHSTTLDFSLNSTSTSFLQHTVSWRRISRYSQWIEISCPEISIVRRALSTSSELASWRTCDFPKFQIWVSRHYNMDVLSYPIASMGHFWHVRLVMEHWSPIAKKLLKFLFFFFYILGYIERFLSFRGFSTSVKYLIKYRFQTKILVRKVYYAYSQNWVLYRKHFKLQLPYLIIFVNLPC